MVVRRVVWTVGVLLVAVLLAACGKDEKGATARRPVPVLVAKAVSGSVPVQIRGVGNVEPYQSVAVRTMVGGQIMEQRVRDGQEVAAGDVLFVLDVRPFLATLKDAQGRLERDVALLKKADDDLVRYTNLKQKDVVSQQQFDQSQTDAKSLRASIKLSEAQIDQARLQVEYATIKAPFAGRVGSVLVNQGNIIKANDDRSLLAINQIQPIYVAFSVPEQFLPEIAARMGKERLAVQVFLAGDDTHPINGVLAVVDNAVDRTTGTIKLKGLFENKDKRLWPGQFARCVVDLANRDNVVTVPAEAVQVGLQGNFIYVLRPDNTAEFRLVETGGVSGGRTVILKGVSAGETVVTDGHVRLAPNLAVEVKGDAKPASPVSDPASGKEGKGS